MIVSNRLPTVVEKRKGVLHFRQSVGGLTTGLVSFSKTHESIWIGWPGIPIEKLNRKEKEELQEKLISQYNNYPVFLSKKNVESYYYGFCNKTIWPLFHCFTQYVIYDKELWGEYKRVNKIFLDHILKYVKSDDTIWIHDYHLMLLPKLIRDKLPNSKIGFFLHIPFPPYEIFRLLPNRKEILEGLLGADLIGFHIYDYVQHFLDCILRILNYEHTLGQMIIGNRTLKTDTFPMGIDYRRFEEALEKNRVQKEINRFRKTLEEKKVILSIDRLDYTKGIPERLEAFDLFLEENPQYKEKVTLILIAVPSRTRVEQYRNLKHKVDELIGKINGKYSTIGWTPIRYFYRALSFYTLVAMYNIADVGLITPLKDGMNLIAKEFIAAKRDKHGVLILSEMAGASFELGEAIIVNPNNREEIAKAIERALSMPESEKEERNLIMQSRLKRYDIFRWAEDFIGSLSQIKNIQKQFRARKFPSNKREELLESYRRGKNRLIILDYDGTLVPFARRPEEAKPDREILRLLKSLARDKKNEIVIASGRDKKIIDEWFSSLNIGLIAEHGAWVKKRKGSWETIEPLQSEWKEEIRPILELYMDRTPGAFIEEKNFSLVWHYRKADMKLSSVRISELKDALYHLSANLNLGVMEGNKVIEVKPVGVNKGRAVLEWLSKNNWDFILCIGDDWTDEDIFNVLPKSSYSLKVGLSPSRANYNLDSVAEVRELIRILTR